VDYEWDSAKAALNRRKHGVDFTDAIPALEDPDRIEDIDLLAHGEERARVPGMGRSTVLFVVTTSRGEARCRIISARRATRHEQDRYYSGDSQDW
jgi:uncharacterized DUF497 family protein